MINRNEQSIQQDFYDQKDGSNRSHKLISNKIDLELFDETKLVAEKVLRIKRIVEKNKIEKWKIFEDTKVVLVVSGTLLSKKEKEFLRTVDGCNFLLNSFKDGLKTANKIKIALKKVIK